MPPNNDTHAELLRIAKENQALLIDVSTRVKALERNARIAMTMRILGLIVFVVLPLIGIYLMFSFVTSALTGVTQMTETVPEISGTLELLQMLQGLTGQ